MSPNRRQFIKTASAGIVGLGIIPVVVGQGNELPNPYDLKDLPRASPESQGVHSGTIRRFIAAANASGFSWHSFMLVRHGQVVAEGWWDPFASSFVHSLYSLSKSFTSTAIGLLVKEGRLDIRAKLASFFPGDLPENPGENFQQITVRHLLTMNSGHAEDTLPKMRASHESWVRTFLAQPVEFAPGSHFLYNTGNTYMLGAILYKVTGETIEKWLAPRLFQPLGITGYDWETSPQGLNTAGYGLRVKTEDIAKLGQLYLQNGHWQGKSILPEDWVREATGFQTSSQAGNGDWSQGYGYQFWRCTHGYYRGDGAYGQYCIVMPELDAVLAVTGQSPDMQKSLNIIWEHLPQGMQASALPENLPEQAELRKDLSDLSLPVIKGATVPALSSRYHNKTWGLATNEFGARTLQLAFSENGCQLSAEIGGKTKTLVFGWEKWIRNQEHEPYIFKAGDLFPMPSRMAGTATWTDDHTLQLNSRFVEAIFGDSLTCSFDGDHLSITFLNSLASMSVKSPDPRQPLSGILT